jgi:hypothetical protein
MLGVSRWGNKDKENMAQKRRGCAHPTSFGVVAL